MVNCERLRRRVEAGDEVGQALALNQNVVLKQPLGPVPVSGQDRVHDPLVLRERARDPASRPQLQPAVGLDPVVELACLLDQEAIRARRIDEVVEALGRILVCIRIAARRLAGADLVRLE